MKWWQVVLIVGLGVAIGAGLVFLWLAIEFSHAWNGMH